MVSAEADLDRLTLFIITKRCVFHLAATTLYICTYIPGQDLISRPKGPVSSVAGGGDTTMYTTPLRNTKKIQWMTNIVRQLMPILLWFCLGLQGWLSLLLKHYTSMFTRVNHRFRRCKRRIENILNGKTREYRLQGCPSFASGQASATV
jgi:hypothetical protein